MLKSGLLMINQIRDFQCSLIIIVAPAGSRRHYRNPLVIENMYGITRKILESQEQGPQRILG